VVHNRLSFAVRLYTVRRTVPIAAGILLTVYKRNAKLNLLRTMLASCASYNEYPLMMASLDAETCREITVIKKVH
jgi:hypothetical protein